MQLSVEEKAELADTYARAAEYIEQNGWFGGWGNMNLDLAEAACTAIALDRVNTRLCRTACEFMQEALELEGLSAPATIFEWNDDPSRTKDEVINTLHALANKLR